jgi:hypothetical protein
MPLKLAALKSTNQLTGCGFTTAEISELLKELVVFFLRAEGWV